MNDDAQPPGWYEVGGHPDGLHRYWDGEQWVGEPQPRPPDMAPDPASHVGQPIGTAGRRLLAKLIDVGVLIGLSILVRVLVDDDLSANETSATAAIATLTLTIVYEVAMVASIGATVGKLVLGLRIVDQSGQYPPSPGTAVMRWIPNALAVIPVVGILGAMAVLLASLIWIFTDPQRRSIFDRAAKTHVIAI